MTTQLLKHLNSLDVNGIQQRMDDVAQDPTKGFLKFQVQTAWTGGISSATQVNAYEYDGQPIPRNFTINADQPFELFGKDTAPNPQELLLAAINSCLLATYVSLCALHDIQLEKLEIDSEGDLNLRGFFGLDDSVKPGYDEIRYAVRIKGDGTPEQFQAIDKTMKATAPNFWNLANAVVLKPQFTVES